MKTLVKGGFVVNAGASCYKDILIENGKITAIEPGIELAEAEVFPADGYRLFPGFIDAHTHFDLAVGGTITADNFQTGSEAALVGGTTTIIDFATQEKGGTLAAALAEWQSKAAGVCACDYGFHLAITDWSPAVADEIPLLAAAGVSSYKVYLAYDALRLRDGEIYEILKRVKDIRGIVGAHCENGDIVNLLTRDHIRQGKTEPRFHPPSRPDLAEAEAVCRFAHLGQLAAAPVHIVHLSSQAGLESALAARRRGTELYIECCPQYLFLTADMCQLPGFEGAKYICSPPLRSGTSQKALWQALAAGDIDTVSTDHCSFNYAGQKELGRGDFSKIPNGLPGVEQRPALMYSGVVDGRWTEQQFVAALAENAARLFGLYPEKGVLAVGSDADIVVWDPCLPGTISAKTQRQNVDYTPYEGFKFQGGPKAVFLRGKLAAQDGKALPAARGKYLSRRHSDCYRGLQ